MIPEDAGQRLREAQFRKAAFAGGEAVPIKEDDARRAFLRPVVEVDFRALAQGAGGGGQAGQLQQPAAGKEERAGAGQHLAAVQAVRFRALDVDGAALSGAHDFGGRAVTLQGAGADGDAFGHGGELFAAFQAAGDDGAGDHRAVALHAEHAVYGQAEEIRGTAGRDLGRTAVDMGAQSVDALAGDGRDGEDGRVFQETALEEVAYVFLHQFEPLGIDHVALGQGHEAAVDAEQGADVEVFAGLRHDAFIRGDDQHDEIHTRGAGHHVFDEALMPRHIDDAQPFPVREFGPGKAQFDGDAAPFLLFEAVAVDAGQRAHQRGLAVIDVSRRAQYKRHETTPFRRERVEELHWI